MKTGNFTDKARPLLVYFVFSCIFVITGLLYTIQKSEATAYEINSVTKTSYKN